MKELIELISDIFSFFQKRPQVKPVDKGIAVYAYISFDKQFVYFLYGKNFYMFTNNVGINRQLVAEAIVSGEGNFYTCREIQSLNRDSKEVYYVKP